jgi:hypothetical protein
MLVSISERRVMPNGLTLGVIMVRLHAEAKLFAVMMMNVGNCLATD